MDDYTFEKRKKVINELIHDKYYTPMKGKEIAMLLNVSKENRNDLYKVLDALVLEGKIGVTSKGKYCKMTKTFLQVFSRVRTEDLVLLPLRVKMKIFLSGNPIPAMHCIRTRYSL